MAKRKPHVNDFPEVAELKRRRERLVQERDAIKKKLDNFDASVEADATSLWSRFWPGKDDDGGVATAAMPSVERESLTRELQRFEVIIDIIDGKRKQSEVDKKQHGEIPSLPSVIGRAKQQIHEDMRDEIASAAMNLCQKLCELYEAQQAVFEVHDVARKRGAPLPDERVMPLLMSPFVPTLKLPLQAAVMRRDYKARLSYIAQEIPMLTTAVTKLLERIK